MSSKAAGKRRAVAPSEDDSHSPVVQDIDDDHDAAEQSRDLKVEQAPIKRAKASGKARAADSEETQTYENGVLRAIVLENFMNHTHLRVDFDPHVNFIVGKNGSGKSAILNALIAGFGSKASSTGRNTNTAKSLIKSGTDHATISIHLANGGLDAFKPSEFGDTIVVETRFEKQGANSYKLRNGPDGAAKRVQKREIDELCTHFNIQASNPCSLLTQEHAKKFLHNGNEEDRYSFFLQAANMASRKLDLLSAQQSIDLLKTRLERAEEGMEAKKEISQKTREEYEGAKQLKQLELDYERLTTLVAWAVVTQREEEAREEQDKADAAKRAERAAIEKTEEINAQKVSLTEQREALERENADLMTTFQRFANQGQDNVKNMKDLKKQKKKLLTEAEESRGEAAALEEEEAGAQRAYEQEMAGLESKKAALHAKAAEKRRKIEEALQAKNKQKDDLEAQIEGLVEEQQKAVQQHREARARVGQLEKQAAGEKTSLDQAEAAGNDKLKQLHLDMPLLVELIGKNQASFKEKPEGPLGTLLQIKDEHKNVAHAAERAMWGNMGLTGFIVTSYADEKVLRSLLDKLPAQKYKRACLKTNMRIFVRKPEARFKDLGARPETDAPCLIDLFHIKSDAVYNLVCDEWKGAKTLLFTDLEEAKAQVFGKLRSHAGLQAFAGDNSKGLKSLAVKGAKNGKGGTEAVEHKDPAKGLLSADSDEVIKYLKQAVKLAEDEVSKARKETAALEKTAKEAQAAEARCKQQADKARKEVQALTNTARQLEAEDATGAADERLQEITNQLREVVQRKAAMAERAEQAEREAAKVQAKLQPILDKTTQIQAQFNELQKMQEAKAAEIVELTGPERKMHNQVRALEKAAKEQRELYNASTAAVQRVTNELRRLTPQIEQTMGERVYDEQRRGVDDIQKELTKVNQRKEKASRKHGGKSIEELRERMTQAEKMLEKGLLDIENVKQTGDAENAAFRKRYKFFVKEVKQKGVQAAQDFNMRLSRKSHAGHLEFDHPEEKLALSVQRNSQDQVPTDRQQPTSRPAECPVAHRQRPRTDRPTVSSAPTPSPDQSHTNPEPAPVHPSTRPPVHPCTRTS